jgi:lipoyl(octanoyl) transferase
MKLNVVSLGRIDYKEALEIQESLQKLKQDKKTDNTLLILEHPPVITLGKRGEYSNIIAPKEILEANNISIYEVGRGGDVTYHGPGQIVGYPIIDLKELKMGVKDFIWRLEEVFIRILAREYNLTAHREEKKYTGVWVGDEKITAIGIAVKRFITMHGFAFNVNTNLEHFRLINPCGITDKGVASLEKLTGSAQNLDKLNKLVIDNFCEVFDFQPVMIEKNKLIEQLKVVNNGE